MTSRNSERDATNLEPELAELDWSSAELLLSHLASSVGLELEAEVLEVACSQLTTAHGEGSRRARLGQACEAMGLHVTGMSGSVADAAAAVGPEHPVVAISAGGEWMLLTDRRGRRVQVRRQSALDVEWVSRDALAAHLDPEHTGSIVWLAISPRAQLEATADRGFGSRPAPGSPSPWARLRGLLRQERHDVFVTLVYAIGVGVLTLATPLAVQALVNTVAFGTLLQPLAVLTALLLAGLIFAAVLRALQAWVVEVLQRRLFLRLVNELSFRLPRVELSAFDRAHGPELVNRFFDIFTIQKAASVLLIGGLEMVLAATVGMVVLAFYHPLLLAFDVLLLLVVCVILFGLGRNATRTAVKESKAKYEVASWLEEIARHPAAFKLAGGPSLARNRSDQLAGAYLLKRRAHFRIVFRQLVGALALQAFASAGILGIGGWLVIERQLTLGQLVAAELIVAMVVASFAKVGKHLETTYDLLAALDKVGQLIDLPLEPVRSQIHLPPSAPGGARVRVKNVAFAFEDHAPLFEDVELALDPGDRVVLTGRSGAGRSILVDVLLGLRAPGAGRVEIEGFDLADVDRRDLRERTALVRGSELVVGTLAENVTFGRRGLGSQCVRAALRAVDLLDEIDRLPEGLNTRIMPDGAPLSQGQAARLVLARAIAARPALLVIDGALDAFDPETRAQLLDTVFATDAPWTLLVVTDDPAVEVRCARRLRLTAAGLVPTRPDSPSERAR